MKTSAAVLHKMYLERPYTTSRPLRIEEVELDTPGFNEQPAYVIQICP